MLAPKKSEKIIINVDNNAALDGLGRNLLMILLSCFLLFALVFAQEDTLLKPALVVASIFLISNEIINLSKLAKQLEYLQLSILMIAALVLGALFGSVFSWAWVVILWPLLFYLSKKCDAIVIIISTSLLFSAIIILNSLWDGAFYTQYNAWAYILIWLYTLFNIAKLYFSNHAIKLPKIIKNTQSNDIVENNPVIITKPIEDHRVRYIAEMSHEIRTPLNAILGFSDSMREGIFGELNPKYKEYIELIHKSGMHLNDIVSDLLDMSKIDAGRYKLNMSKIDIAAFADEVMQLQKGSALKSSINLEFIGSNPQFINADKKALRQIILNLLSNSIKFTPENGEILLSVYGNENNVWLEVEDSGRGMSNEEIARIGEPYASSEDNPKNMRSTGLGLALVKKLVEMHNAEFEVKSKLGNGTIISIKFIKAS